MDSRREFLKKAALLSGAAGFTTLLPPSIQRALAIDPPPGSTYLDAEHVVILMQENRSFDHCYGTLQGVRGFNDPRAITLPNGNPVWLQANDRQEVYAPFRLNIRDTKATWMGSLPHSWPDQVDARNNGKYDQWLVAKRSGHKDYHDMPLTLGYYNREDIPFYYSLADAFTVCDQNFCSSLTGTTPNRLYLWTGTIREKATSSATANVSNADVDYGSQAKWKTFPERLEENGISWRIYQNELSVVGLEGEADAWLANFTDNPIEWFEQYHVKFHPAYRKSLPRRILQLQRDISELQMKIRAAGDTTEGANLRKQQRDRMQWLEQAQADEKTFTEENYQKLSAWHHRIHEKAFTTNTGDLYYHTLEPYRYNDGQTERTVNIPKGDVLHQFRQDVKAGTLPTVSWVVAPENFSDHPGAPWYGAWYLSEVMDILTQNPEVWKKTIFILAYDENDGYFDHVPPFTAPNPIKPGTGKVSEGIDSSLEFVTLKQDRERDAAHARESSIGLGYRVPLVIASPWSRGGAVCSQVFDHTSVLQFLEKFLGAKTGKKIEEENISAWRRSVCGDLTSAFVPYNGEIITLPKFVERDALIADVHKAQFKDLPRDYHRLTATELDAVRRGTMPAWMPRQEKGTRTARALPYQLYAEGKLSADRKSFSISFEARKEVFGERAAGAAFNVQAPGMHLALDAREKNSTDMEAGRMWCYATAPGKSVSDTWLLQEFEGGAYHLRVDGPNGFYRLFKGNSSDPALETALQYEAGPNGKLTGNVVIELTNTGKDICTVSIEDKAYKAPVQKLKVAPGKTSRVTVVLAKSYGWYDLALTVNGFKQYGRRFAGRVETGAESVTDPAMAGV